MSAYLTLPRRSLTTAIEDAKDEAQRWGDWTRIRALRTLARRLLA